MIIAIFWYGKDRYNARKSGGGDAKTESFSVLMSVFFWSAILSLFLKMSLDVLVFYARNISQYSLTEYLVIGVEDLVKIFALIIGLNIAGKKFNEISDGAIYAVMAALGFLFQENLMYLIGMGSSLSGLTTMIIGRNLFSLAAHFNVAVFGIAYALAYLKYTEAEKNEKRPQKGIKAPYDIWGLAKKLWQQYHWHLIWYLPFSPFCLLLKILRKKTNLHQAEVLWAGTIGTYYWHLLYDFVLNLNYNWLNGVLFAILGITFWIAYNYFGYLDKINKSKSSSAGLTKGD
ncbi:MAG TPA: PrsW family glutamic-type intramembrane protease [Candidatus Gracilibacteria bacterium]|nr:PrsW family glutamic-type intramembrane protease [Candidatus Gracilibacteria bacterium]